VSVDAEVDPSQPLIDRFSLASSRRSVITAAIDQLKNFSVVGLSVSLAQTLPSSRANPPVTFVPKCGAACKIDPLSGVIGV
jgi:hypothetical protein